MLAPQVNRACQARERTELATGVPESLSARSGGQSRIIHLRGLDNTGTVSTDSSFWISRTLTVSVISCVHMMIKVWQCRVSVLLQHIQVSWALEAAMLKRKAEVLVV